MTEPEPGELLERTHELQTIAAAMDRVHDAGSMVLIEGPAGIGKSRLLTEARALASERRMRILSARAAELERGFPLGLVRQLFEGPLRAADAAERDAWFSGAASLAQDVVDATRTPAGDPADTGYARLHGLYWLCVNMTDDGPLLMLVDDLHWADEPTLRFLSFLTRRLPDVQVVVVAATRTDEPGAHPLASSLATEPATAVLRLSPLSRAAVAARVRAAVAESADEDFCAACHVTTGGNPLLLGELLREVSAERIAPTAAEAPRVEQLAPGGVARIVLLRLARLGPDATALAKALAILDGSDTLAAPAALANLDPDAAAGAAAELVRAEVLAGGRELRFVHPIVRAAIYEDVPEPERRARHAAAAALLRERGEPPLRTAPHLLPTESAGNPEVASTLRAAAEQAMTLGDPATAAAYLERGLAEDPPVPQRAAMLGALGLAEHHLADPQATDHLREAAELAKEPAESGRHLLELSRALRYEGRFVEGTEVLGDALTRLDTTDPELAETMAIERLGNAHFSQGCRRLLAPELATLADPGEPHGRLDAYKLVLLAAEHVVGGGSADHAAGLARRAIASGLLRDPIAIGSAIGVLIWCERFDAAEQALGEQLAASTERGAVSETGAWLGLRAISRYRRGDLVHAEADAVAAAESDIYGLATSTLALVAIDRGLAEGEAERLDAAILEREQRDHVAYADGWFARAQLRAARDDHGAALDQLLELGRHYELWDSVCLVPWRSAAALSAHALGHTDQARALATEELDMARAFQGRRALAIALHAAGVVTSDESLLREAVAVTDDASAGLVRARALVELGASMRRRNAGVESREPLREGMDLADRCGAGALAQRAHEELLASGAKPRRRALAGIASLTPSERRVAELAATGMTNREIAQALFVTEKTVETHLGHSYAKLGIRSRADLAGALTP